MQTYTVFSFTTKKNRGNFAAMNLFQHILYYTLHQIKGKSAGKADIPFPSKVFGMEPVHLTADPEVYGAYMQIRLSLQSDRTPITVTDYGAGDREQTRRTIASIARKASQKSRFNTLQYHLVKHAEPTTILEMGTSLGLTTALLAMAAPQAQIITMEGCPNTAAKADELFKALGLSNITLVIGEFDQNLDDVLKSLEKVDYIYFDGNHRMAPTLNYFLKGLAHSHPGSIFVFDDIRWSEQMYNAWLEINRHPAITRSFDLYSVGILTFDPAPQKQYVALRY
jgi:predicted O-methyltransferase YrrM